MPASLRRVFFLKALCLHFEDTLLLNYIWFQLLRSRNFQVFLFMFSTFHIADAQGRCMYASAMFHISYFIFRTTTL